MLAGETGDSADSVYELNCNIDDMTAETIGFAAEKIREAGAVEVFTTAVMMKKNRPGTLLTVLCREAQKEAVVQAIFKHTATIGIRETLCRRYVLTRTEETVETFAHAILDDINPRDSWRASKAFRQHIAVEIAKRCLVKSIELAGGELA